MCKEAFQKSFIKRFLTTSLALTILAFLITKVSAQTITVPTNAYFGFGTNCYINFNTEKTFTTIYRENNYWYFDGYGFQVQNANMTITQFFMYNQLKFTLNRDSGTSTAKIYVDDLGEPASITGAVSWSYSSVSKIITLSAIHSSSVNIVVSWQAVPPPPTGTVNLYFPSGQSIGFQFPEAQNYNQFYGIVTVSSGNLNGTNVVLTMKSHSGEMKFTELEYAVLVPQNVTVLVNNVEKTGNVQVSPTDNVIFKWVHTPTYPQLPIMFIIGMMGACGFIGAPTIIVLKLKSQSDPMDKIKFSILMAVFWLFSVAFLLVWMSGGG